MQFWDQQYSAPGFKYGTAPNAFLVEQAAQLPPHSTILLPGDGEGRNSIWLATQGHHVTAFDSSAVGLAKTQARASELALHIHTVQIDLADWHPLPSSADAVVLTYVHLPAALRAMVHQRALSALRDGGLLIVEAFHPEQLGRPSGGPKDVAMLYTLDMLRDDLAQVIGVSHDELIAWEGEVLLDEGWGHQGLARIVRFAVRRTDVALR